MTGTDGKAAASLAATGASANVAAASEFAIIIISHGALAVELKKALEHLMGPQPLVAALSIPADEPLSRTRQRLQRIIDALPRQHAAERPLVFLSDLFGGTPANLALEQVRRLHGASLITGANLPVLVRLAELRGQVPPRRAVEEAAAVGRRFIRTEYGAEG